MKPWVELCQRCTFFCADCLLSFCRWTLWLTLALLVTFQIYIGIAREMPVPAFLVHSLETRLASSGISVKFGRTIFDPSGRVLVENLRLSLDSFEEPVATARLLYVELDPWALLTSRFEPRQLRASGVNLQVPGMMSDSGNGEDLLKDMDFTLTPHEQSIELHHLTTRLAGLSVSAHGIIDLSSLPRVNADSLPIAELLVTNYPRICSQLIQLSRQIASIHSPRADIDFLPSAKFGAIARVTLRGNGMDSSKQHPFTAGQFELTTRLPLWGYNAILARIAASAESVNFPNGVQAKGLRAILLAELTGEKFELSPQSAELEIDQLMAQGVAARAMSASLQLGDLPKLDAEIVTLLGHEPVKITGTVNISERSANLHAVGKFDPALLVPIGWKIGRDIRPFLNFGDAPEFDLNLQLNPGGKFGSVEGLIAATNVYAYRVTLDRVGGHIAFDGTNFVATEAAAWLGTNFARGSYEHNISTRDFRFLLAGQLRPSDISGWFREWWPNFWQKFDFPADAPDASVDIRGIWGQGYKTSVFVYADCTDPVIKGVKLDHATTLIYLRPRYYDAMAVNVSRNTGTAHGSFIRILSDESKALQRMDFNFESSLGLDAVTGLVGPKLQEIVAPFKFTTPPRLNISGFIADPKSSPYRHIEVQGSSTGSFMFHAFPLSDLSFSAVMHDDELQVEPVYVGFAGGKTSGKLQIWGPSGQHRLGFDIGLKQGNMHKASVILADYFAARRGEPPPTSSPYIQQTDKVSIDLDVSAEGDLDDPLSFMGSGNAVVSGPGLGEIRLLGLLSELLNFTALRFNDLRTSFSVKKDRLVFSEASITGTNSAVAARGTYSLDQHTLDFNARIFPFQESTFILKSLVGTMLTPLSNVLVVKLAGELDHPKWSFVIGPTNFLRNLTQPIEGRSPAEIISDPAPTHTTQDQPPGETN